MVCQHKVARQKREYVSTNSAWQRSGARNVCTIFYYEKNLDKKYLIMKQIPIKKCLASLLKKIKKIC